MYDLRYQNTHFLQKMMLREGVHISTLGRSNIYLLNDGISYSIGKGGKEHEFEISIKNNDEPIIHILTPLGGMSHNEHIQNVDKCCKRNDKLALLHTDPKTNTKELNQLLGRIFLQHGLIDTNKEDFEIAISFTKECQHIILTDGTVGCIKDAVEESEAVIGFIVVREKMDVATHKKILRQTWKSTKSMVSIGLVVDPCLDSDYEVHLLSFRGSNQSHSNVVTVIPSNILREEIDSSLQHCANAHRKGADRCSFHEEKLSTNQLFWCEKREAHICPDCYETTH